MAFWWSCSHKISLKLSVYELAPTATLRRPKMLSFRVYTVVLLLLHLCLLVSFFRHWLWNSISQCPLNEEPYIPLSVRPSPWWHLHLSPPYDVLDKPYLFWKLIIWWWRWPRQRHTKRQRQRHTDTDKYKYKVLLRPNECYIFQGFKILYWLSSCDNKDPILCIIRGNIFQG